MKNFLHHFNKAFENRVRLGIMSVLVVNDDVSFNTLKDLLNATDGNLASHLKALEKLDYLVVNKEFIERKPHTSYAVTKLGKQAFQEHLDALEDLLKKGL